MERPRPKIKKKVFDEDKSNDKGGEDKVSDEDEFTEEAVLNAAILLTLMKWFLNIEDDSLSNPRSMGSPNIEEFEDKNYKTRYERILDDIELAKNELRR